jgi:hypothetical protein
LSQNVPVTQQGTWNADDSAVTAALTPTVNTWDSTTIPLQFAAHVPEGERWLVHFQLASWMQGNNAPTYQIGIGLVLKGATRLEPPHPNSPSPWSYHLGIATAGDQAWGTVSVPVWLNPGKTLCCFAHGRDAGALILQRRHISGVPILGMKV